MTANVPPPMIVEAAVEDRSKVTAQTRMLNHGELPSGGGAPGKQIGAFGGRRQGHCMKQDLEAEYNEERVIRAAQAGDREAFALLYEAHVDRVYHYLLRRMGQPADAEDVTAEVFIRAMKALESFEIRGAPFVAWLLRIANSMAFYQMKKQSRRREVPLQDNLSGGNDPADLALNQVASEEVSRAMQGLTALQRQVMTLRYMAQLSIAETAAKMERTEGAIKFLQHSAIRALQRTMGRQEASKVDG